MIVSRKAGYTIWKNLEGYYSRLSVSCLGEAYEANGYFHRLYGGSYYDAWDINGKSFRKFKGV